jgi:hypothetical protein
MGQINLGRVIAAGLLAGLILNIGEAGLHGGLLGPLTADAYQSLGRTAPQGASYLLMLVGMTFVQGILAMWLYAAIRPRLGAGPKTAVCAGLAVWFFSSVYAAVYLHAGFPGILTANLVWLPVAWQLVEFPLAALAGAAVYRE